VIRRAQRASPARPGVRGPRCRPGAVPRAVPGAVIVIATVAWTLATGAHAQPPASGPPGAPEIGSESGSEIGSESGRDIRDQLARLEGQRVRILDEGTAHDRKYVIEDVASEGAPVVGVVERRGQALWLVAEDGASYRLAGALARPRIAGPGYKIWALGAVTAGSGERILVARRIGVLAPPLRRAQARGARRTIFAISAGAPTRTGGPQ
jgi:hypothetical protein